MLARAEVACREAVQDDPENVRLRFNLGQTLVLLGREEGTDHLRWAAERGHAGAQYRLGEVLWYGQFGREDREAGEILMDRAAQQLERAARKGNRKAQRALALIRLAKGDGNGAETWFSAAVEQGDVLSRPFLGELLVRDPPGTDEHERGLALLKEAAERGDSYGQYALGSYVFFTSEEPEEIERGLELLNRSASDGSIPSMIRLMQIYLEKPDDELTQHWSCALIQALPKIRENTEDIFSSSFGRALDCSE